MSRMPGAEWRPIPVNYTRHGQEHVRGLVVHIMDGTLAGTDSWFRNTASEVSAHFGTGRGGKLYQWVDTGDRAWAEAAGNRTWLSVENEGKGGDALTSAQLDRCAEILAWTHHMYGVPLLVAHDPSGHGLGYHSMGGAAWGGHTSCPGRRVVDQLQDIVDRASRITDGTSSSGTAPSSGEAGHPARYQRTINGLTYGYGAEGDHVTAVGRALVNHGCGKHYTVGPGPRWTDADTENYSAYQQKLGYHGTAPHEDADGVPGPTSLRRLLGGELPGPHHQAAPDFPGRDHFRLGHSDPAVTELGRQLKTRGFDHHHDGNGYQPGPIFTRYDRENVADFQRSRHELAGDPDGYPGPRTWRLLFS